MSPRLPAWLNGMTALVAVSNLFVFGLLAFFDPHLVFPSLDEAAEYPARFFAIRHVALAFPLIHGLLRQDRVVLGAMYRIFLVIAVLDVGSILFFGWPYPFIGALPFVVNAMVGLAVFVLPMLAGVLALSRRS